MLRRRRSMDKNPANGEQNLVEWVWPHLGERQRFYRLLDPRLEGRFSIKGAQKALQLAAHCLSHDLKARPLKSEVVEVLKSLPDLEDMASSSSHFQSLQAERGGSGANARNGGRMQTGLSRTGHSIRSVAVLNGSMHPHVNLIIEIGLPNLEICHSDECSLIFAPHFACSSLWCSEGLGNMLREVINFELGFRVGAYV